MNKRGWADCKFFPEIISKIIQLKTKYLKMVLVKAHDRPGGDGPRFKLLAEFDNLKE